MIKNELDKGILTEEELLPPEGENLTTKGKTSKKLPESPSIAPPCRHEIEQDTDLTPQEQATESEPESKKTDLSTNQTHEDSKPTESQTTGEPPMFFHKIGGTTYKVAVHFDTESKHTFKDKMERLLTHQMADNQE